MKGFEIEYTSKEKDGTIFSSQYLRVVYLNDFL